MPRLRVGVRLGPRLPENPEALDVPGIVAPPCLILPMPDLPSSGEQDRQNPCEKYAGDGSSAADRDHGLSAHRFVRLAVVTALLRQRFAQYFEYQIVPSRQTEAFIAIRNRFAFPRPTITAAFVPADELGPLHDHR